eukprot:1176693-Prorocentrum_minimum.AAC.1
MATRHQSRHCTFTAPSPHRHQTDRCGSGCRFATTASSLDHCGVAAYSRVQSRTGGRAARGGTGAPTGRLSATGP